MVSRKRTLKMEKLARLYDDQILPVWADRFGRLILRNLELPEKGQFLDVACGTGYPSIEILRRMGENCRLIAIDPSSAMLDIARKKVELMGRKGVFFRTESASPRLSFADEVYDLVICNLGLGEMANPSETIADFARVTVPGGEVRCTLPLAGTFQEFYDIFREVLVKHDKHDAIDRLNAHLARYPTVEACERWLKRGFFEDARVDVDEFTLLFKSSREFFFAPVIEFGPLARWKQISGAGQEMQDVFWYIKEAIDAYFGGRAFEITVRAGALIATKATEDADTSDEADDTEQERTRETTRAGKGISESSASTNEDSAIVLGTDEIDIQALDEVAAETDADDEEIDAFVEGKTATAPFGEVARI